MASDTDSESEFEGFNEEEVQLAIDKVTPIKFLVLQTNDQKKLGRVSDLLFIIL
jgi:hypothetical protein